MICDASDITKSGRKYLGSARRLWSCRVGRTRTNA